eukprot:gene25550-30853_t
MGEGEEESRSACDRILNVLLTFVLPSAKLNLQKHWALALVIWFFLVASLMFAMLFYYFYNDCQLQFVDVDAKAFDVAVFVSFYLLRHKIQRDGVWSTLFSANAWLDIFMDAFDQSLPSLENHMVGKVSALRGAIKRSSIVQSRLSKVVPANEAIPSAATGQSASTDNHRKPSISEAEKVNKVPDVACAANQESPWGAGSFANRLLRSMFPHITIVIPSGVWSWSFILWMLASFFTMFIVLLMYFLYYDCTSGQTIVNAAFTDYRPDIYNEVFNTNNRHICSSRIYGAFYELQDKVPYDCVLPGLTCKDYDTVFARGACSARHCDDSLPCINHVYQGILNMSNPNICFLSSCLIDVEYANCLSSYEAVMIAFQYTLLAKVAMASVFFVVYFLYHNGPFFLCEKATWLSFWACLNPTEPEEQGDAEKGQPAATAPKAAGYELVSMSPRAPIDSEPAEAVPETKQQHASDSGTWSVVTRAIQRAVDYVDQVLLATVIPLSRHQFHGRKSYAFLFWFVLASGAVFGSLLWYFLADCQVTSSIVDFAEADSTFREPTLGMCKSSTFLGVFDPCVYNEHHICGASVKNRRETDCTENSVDYVGYHAVSGGNICGILSSSAVFSCAFGDNNCNPGSLDYIASYMPFWVEDDDGGGGIFNAGYVVPCVVKGMTCDDYGSFLPDKYCGTKICKNNRFCSQPIAAHYNGPIGSAEYYICNTVALAFITAIQYTMLAQVAIVLLYFVYQRFAQYGVTAVTKKKFWNNLLELR